MKLKIYSVAFLALLLMAFGSCKKDKPASVPNQTNYDGTTYNMKAGLTIDYGTSSYFGSSDTHTNYDFYITDGSFTFSNNGQPQDIIGKIGVYFSLESPDGTGNFKNGTYTYVDTDNDATLTDQQLQAKYENKYFMYDGSILVGNGDINSSLQNGQEIYVQSGTVVVSGTKPNYKVDFDLLLQNNKTIKGSYSGEFSNYVD